MTMVSPSISKVDGARLCNSAISSSEKRLTGKAALENSRVSAMRPTGPPV